MGSTFERSVFPTAGGAAAQLPFPGVSAAARPDAQPLPACFHCGEACKDSSFAKGPKTFCCQGCLMVHDILAQSGLDHFYDLTKHPGVKIRRDAAHDRWAFLEDPAVQQRLIQFSDDTISRVTFHIPSIHCVACVWLLENLFRLNPDIGESRVNFARRDVSITFAHSRLNLASLVSLLASIGYEPSLTLRELDAQAEDHSHRKQWLQVGIAGFAFGNIMLFSLPSYLGMDSLSGPSFRSLFGWLSLLLALPVLIYSASDYWRSAYLAFHQKVLTLDVPIALGLAALYAQSAYEIFSGKGEGYLDSMAGLIFLLLCGRIFQKKTHERILFDRDYKSFFPLSVVRKQGLLEETVAISGLVIGDRLVLRNGELIPADARLISGSGCIDYSFVTGESEPVTKAPGDYLYAGGQQTGGAIEVEIVKPVSQSYLTSLWSHEAFQKSRDSALDTLTNQYSKRFTKIVIAIALLACAGWTFSGDTERGLKALASVLIVACPCALALAAPFTLGTTQRLLARLQIFTKNGHTLEKLSRSTALVFDKTGTLTSSCGHTVAFYPVPRTSSQPEVSQPALPITSLVSALCRQSTHPISTRIAQSFISDASNPELQVADVEEIPGAGVRGKVAGRIVELGSAAWLRSLGRQLPALNLPVGSASFVSVDGKPAGAFVLNNSLRPDTEQLLQKLSDNYQLALLSGDNERERHQFQSLFGASSELRFNQSPLEKLAFIGSLQQSGHKVVMVGDGLNDAGALKQSDVGIAVVERPGAFSPACDMILPANHVPHIARLLRFSRQVTTVVRASFAISAVYNLIGISIAAAGILSPLICAVLMPLSSASVVLFACGATTFAARKSGLTPVTISYSPPS